MASSPYALVGRLIGAGAGAGADASAGGARAPVTRGAVVVDGGRIAAVEAQADPARLPARRIEAAFVAPGLVDLQVNGAFGVEVGDDPAALLALAARLPATGVTAFLPTLVSRTEPEYRRAFAAFDEANVRIAAAAAAAGDAAAAARVLGLHLEGPLLASARAGAHDRAAIAAADAALVERLGDPARVRLVTLAPERPDALAVVARLRARGVAVSLGHTDATFDEMVAGIDAGATLVTHLFSAMSPFHHRAPGAAGAALTDDRVTALFIADGVHAHAAALRLAVRAKGLARLALVTDAVAAAGMAAGAASLSLAGRPIVSDGLAVRLADGTLAGSTLTLDRAVQNAARMAALAPADAVSLATAVPAAALGLPHLGRLTAGAAADLILLDEDLGIVATFTAGALAYDRDGRAADR